MRRSSRNIFLALVGSAGLLTCCVSSCVDFRDEPEKDKDGNLVRDRQGHVVTHRHYVWRPWLFDSGGYYSGYRSGGYYSGSGGSSYTPARTGPATTGGSRSTSTTTSRGGFGGTGHATAGS
ncbi:MAG TPA: hypothetical protein VL371_18900 [Gemmataceae bacterium]|jgi:hypothetical protein|nr:hypothetical protein [Gemmataceae bacterium]